VIHSIARYWEDPHTFKPERFLKDWPRDAFLPFSAGARACIGRKSVYSHSTLPPPYQSRQIFRDRGYRRSNHARISVQDYCERRTTVCGRNVRGAESQDIELSFGYDVDVCFFLFILRRKS